MARTDTITKKISDFLRCVGRRRLWIQTHDIPDPDAIAAAEALRVIAREHGVHARIVCNGLPARRQNRVLLSECKIRIHPLESVKIRSAARSAWAYIDCLPGGGNVTMHQLAPGDLYMAIDHHKRPDIYRKEDPKIFIAVDPSVGATATMLAKALFRLEVPFPPRLASAISYAIITDTQDFSRGATEADLEMYSSLFPFTNQRIISRLRNVSKPRRYFRIVHSALENTFTYRYVAWAFVGEVLTGESVAEMADFILSCERITWALALGYTQDRLFISLRSSQPKARCARLIHRLVDDLHGTVGGHNEFAGGFLFLDGDSDTTMLADLLIRRFVRIVLRLKKSAEDPEGSPLVED